MDERKLKKILRNNGYYKVDRHGSGNHQHFKKEGVERLITINGGKKTNCMVVKRLMKQIQEDGGALL